MVIELSGFQKRYIRLIKPLIFSAVIVFICVINNSAQGIRIEETGADSKGKDSICGRIKDEELSIPSYRFRVTDKNGAVVKNLNTKGELVIEEEKWTQNGLFDFDPYWKTIYHDIKIPVVYDDKEGIYITQEMSKVRIEKRKKRITKCLDKVTKLLFTFDQNDCNSTYFYFFFPNRMVDKINLPNAEKIYDLQMIAGKSCVKGN